MNKRWILVWCLGMLCLVAACAGGGGGQDGAQGEGASTKDGGNNAKPDGANNTPDGNNAKPDVQAPTAITPLASTAFVYVHYPRDSGVGHIYGYDTATKKSWLISKLDDDGTTGTSHPTPSLSADRKWIAFRGFFRPTADDLATKLATPAIWLMSVDGKQFRRLSATIPNPHLKGATCTVNSQCAATGYCNTAWGRCAQRNYSIGLGKPEWSSDGKTLWFGFSTHWWVGTRITGGVRPASVSVNGGVVELHTSSSGCAQVSNLATHPKNPTFAAVHSVCSGGSPGLFSYGMPPTQGTQFFNNAEVGVELETPVWSPDGSIVFFLADTKWDLDSDGQAETQGKGIVGYNTSTKQLGGLLPPLKSELSYRSFAIDPTGNKMVLCIRNSQTSGSDLYLFDAQDKQEPFKTLITDGKSCDPSW